ncbi:MAG TPA: NAD-dependent epimerase/dehydratase family protein [Ktedonobacteraceae bacterium]|nr:NAD-dependent epimerase/dehydratase family protein [Ktedonobacteraceae bacterium]
MKIAITGGAGFVGSHLATAYLDAGHDVFIIDTLVNSSPRAAGALDPRARFYAVDIRDARLHTIFQNERPDIVSHHAVQYAQQFYGTQALIDADVHIRGLLNVLEACVSASVQKLIFASNGTTMYRLMPLSEYEQQGFPLVKEDAPLCPQRSLDISKVAGEWYVRCYTLQHGLAHTILRYADIYGSETAQHPVSYFAAMLAANQRPVIRGSGLDIRDHIFIDDVAQANLCVLERGKNSTLHIASGQGYSQYQFFCAVAQQLSSALLPVYLAGASGEPTAVVMDNTLAWQTLGWKPRIGFTEGIQRMVERLRSEKMQARVEEPVRVEEAVLV